MRTMTMSACVVLVLLAATARGQDAPDLSKSANPELIGLLSKEAGVTPAQAEGGAGALLGLAKTRLKPEEFSEVSAAIPGTDALLKAAPAMSGAAGALGGGASALGGLAGAAGLASLGGSFAKLGMKPEAAAKLAPTLLNYVNGKGSTNAASLLTRAFK